MMNTDHTEENKLSSSDSSTTNSVVSINPDPFGNIVHDPKSIHVHVDRLGWVPIETLIRLSGLRLSPISRNEVNKFIQSVLQPEPADKKAISPLVGWYIYETVGFIPPSQMFFDPRTHELREMVMAYARFDSGDVYVFKVKWKVHYGRQHDALVCCMCSLHKDGWSVEEEPSRTRGEHQGKMCLAMIEHLRDHIAAGDAVPEHAIRRLQEEADACAKKGAR